MIHYNALTPKPHYAYSNSSRISQLDMGKLVRKTVDQDANLKTCETYVDSEGNKRFKGTKRLRQTELLMEYPVRFGFKLVDMFDDLTKTNRGQDLENREVAAKADMSEETSALPKAAPQIGLPEAETIEASNHPTLDDGAFNGIEEMKSRAVATGGGDSKPRQEEEVEKLEQHVKKLDNQYDECNKVMAKGEINKFGGTNAKRYEKKDDATPATKGNARSADSKGSKKRIVQEVSALDCIKFQLPAAHATAGKVLQHSLKIMDDLLDTHAPAIFKVGFTHNPAWRWSNDLYGYAKSVEKYSNMIVLYITDEPWGPAMLEAALIQHYRGTQGCKNSRLGGDTVNTSLTGLFMCYVVYRPLRAVLPSELPKDEKAFDEILACLAHDSASMLRQGVVSNTGQRPILLDIPHEPDRSDLRADPMLLMCAEATSCMNSAFEALYTQDLWLPGHEARRIGQLGLRFMELYGKLARHAYDNGQALWAFMPKAAAVVLLGATGYKVHSGEGSSSLSFEDFLQLHGRSYDSQEYLERQALFEQRKAEVIQQNNRSAARWRAAVNKFADFRDEEREALHGYKPSQADDRGV
ncbi:unnamed protein product [Durusdinium trenchii]|uniref:Cathepsin propeptide inhibitor domain-containing protein n=1 Tax=Durusdinium trenchii TaxID=1381693 RepID=A0ABP0Q3L6_9DINO